MQASIIEVRAGDAAGTFWVLKPDAIDWLRYPVTRQQQCAAPLLQIVGGMDRDTLIVIDDRSFVTGCDTIQCALPELTHYNYNAINNIERASCRYQCMPVEIDNSGEVRYYSTWISFERFPDGCFERPGDILFIVQVS